MVQGEGSTTIVRGADAERGVGIMNRRTIQFGLLVGVIGGTLMALWIMTMSAVLGNGFVTPVNLIAHTFWRGAPIGGAFDLGALALGLAIHLTIAISLGLLLATLVERGALDGGVIFFLALGLGVSAWIVQAFAWPTLDPSASSAVTPWVFALAHVIFSVGAAVTLMRLEVVSPVIEVTPPTIEPTPEVRIGWSGRS